MTHFLKIDIVSQVRAFKMTVFLTGTFIMSFSSFIDEIVAIRRIRNPDQVSPPISARPGALRLVGNSYGIWNGQSESFFNIA